MEKKINIAELLKNCPKDMELDCTMYDNLYLDKVEEDCRYPIGCYTIYDGCRTSVNFTEFGKFNSHAAAKCVIFPKGKTTWEGFEPHYQFKSGDVLVSEMGNIVLLSHVDSESFVHYHCIIPTFGSFRIEENTSIGVGRYYECVLANEQQKQRMYDKIKSSGYKYNQNTNKLEKLNEPKFKDGDIITDSYFDSICIFKGKGSIEGTVDFYCGINAASKYIYIKDVKDQDEHFGEIDGYNFATEEEKAKLFKAIKDNGYKWNAETKTLEKLQQFKVGDRIRKKGEYSAYTISHINYGHYLCENCVICDIYDNDWELVPNKFNNTTLKPFESRVLVRDIDSEMWKPDFFGHLCDNEYSPFMVVGGIRWKQCIPYEGNEHLLGTTNDCDEYYKTWK